MRRAIKFLHTIGAIGLMGALACLLALSSLAPAPTADTLAAYAALRGAMDVIASWIVLPSLALTLVAGLVSMAATPAFHNAGWALVKLATGVLVFEAGFAGVVGPMQEEAARSAAALAGSGDIAALGQTASAETGTLWVLMAIALANVALGIWRPRLARRAAARGSAVPEQHLPGA